MTALYRQVDGPADAPVVVLSNALGTDVRLWEPQLPALAERFRVVRYDSRGHGRSAAPPGPYTLAQLGLDLLALLDELRVARAHLCGLSLGGLVAQWLAVHHPDRVDRLVLANTAARIGSVESWSARIDAVNRGGLAAVCDAVVARWLSAGFRSGHPDIARRVGEMLAGTPPHGYVAACAALRDADLRAEVGHIAAPTLIVAGALDDATPVAQAEELRAAIATSRLRVLEAAHLANVERPAEFNHCVKEFLADV